MRYTFTSLILAAVAAMVALLHIAAVPFTHQVRRLRQSPVFVPALTGVAVLLLAFVVDRHALFALPIVFGVTTLTEGAYASEFILSEANGTLSRDAVTVTVPAGEKYSPGLVLGKVTSGGKYVGRDGDAMTGEQVAAGVLNAVCDNSDGDAPLDFTSISIVNYAAEVRGEALDANGGDEDDVLDELLDLGIKVRGTLTNLAT